MDNVGSTISFFPPSQAGVECRSQPQVLGLIAGSWEGPVAGTASQTM